MGGTIILISVLVTCLFFVGRYPRIIPVLFLTLGFGIIGFLDDYLKVVPASSGLLPNRSCVTVSRHGFTVFVVYLIFMDESGLAMVLPFTDYVLDIKWITVPLAYFAIWKLTTVSTLLRRSGTAWFAAGTAVAVFTIASRVLRGGMSPVTAAEGRRTFGLPAL